MRYYRLIISIFLLNTLWTSLLSQQYLFDAQLFTNEDGLANSQTYSLFQDSKGFLWVGSKYGLNRYDGYTFEVFNEENSGLRENHINREIVEDEEGNLWLTHINDHSVVQCDIFRPGTNKAIPFEDYFAFELSFDAKYLQRMGKITSSNTIWVFTYEEEEEGALYFYKNKQFVKVMEGIPENLHDIITDSYGNLWLKCLQTLLHITPEGQILDKFSYPLSLAVSGIWIDEDDRLWVAIWDDSKNIKTIHKKYQNQSQFEPFLLKTNSPAPEKLHEVFRGKNGFWYVNFDKNLHIFDYEGNWLYNVNSIIDKPLEIINILESDNYVWITTPTGLLQLSIEESFFRIIHPNKELFDYRGITEDREGNIYFLSTYAYRYNPKTNVIYKFPNPHFRGTFNLLYKDPKILAGVYMEDNLFIQLNQQANRIKLYPSSFANLPYFSLESDIPNKYYVGNLKGICFLDLNNETILPFEQYNEFLDLKNTSVLHLHRNTDGIWAASEKGIYLLTEAEGVIRHFDQSSGHLPFDYIRHIHEDEQGVFWLATVGGGLIRWEFDAENNFEGKSEQFNTQNGLANDYLYAVYEDDYNRLWMPSDKGLMQMDKHTNRVNTYTVKDGLPHNEFNKTSHFQAKDGRLYFGGLGGLVSFHPDNVTFDTSFNVPLEFTSCQLLKGDDEELTDQMEVLRTSGEIVIAPNDKLFEIEFALLDFDKPENHRYAYQIEGYDDKWRNIEENFLRINQLPYGHYTLKVKGQNINKGWSAQELKLKLEVLKPFYLQWWFIMLSIIALAAAVFAFIKRREQNLKSEQIRLETEVKKRTQQIQKDKATIEAQAEELKQLDKAKTRFFANITHEFRTPLTLIIGPLEQVIENQPPPNIFKRRLKGVLNNAKHLLTLINQMLDLSKLESGQMNTEVTKGDIINYTQELVKRFEPMIEKKRLRFKFVSNIEIWETHFDKDKWDKIIYNLLSNALKFTPKEKTIQMTLMKTVHKDRETIRLDVKDTGRGIKKEQLDKIFNRFFQADDSSRREQEGTGIGLALVKELVELQGGEIWVSSRVNHGTTFEIYLPVLKYKKEVIVQPLEVPDFSISTPVIEKTTDPIPVPNLEKEDKLELLIIEDNEEIREYIQYCLDTSKYNITEAVNGEDGILKAQTTVPDLIISDVMMPRKNGFEVVEEVRNNLVTSHIPIILLTAKASLESRLKGLKHGADAYLTKPFSPQELALRIEKLIEVRQMLQRRYQNTFQNNQPTNGEETFQKEDKFITELKEYILQNIDETNLTGDVIGRQFGMSRVHLFRKLKALANLSVTGFVARVRLEKARELLLEGELNISEITYQTGFSSLSHFSRMFKKVYGIAPSKFDGKKI